MHIGFQSTTLLRFNLVTDLVGFILLTGITQTQAAPDHELVYKLKASVVKVHVSAQSGGHGVGTGVVVAPDVVDTNCHVLSQATGVYISKMGDSISSVSMQADWAHDVCLLRFQYLNLPAVTLRYAESLKYGEEIFSIGFPGGPPKPQTSAGTVSALYPFENSFIVRTDAPFMMGASGSPIFDSNGALVAMSTFKSPGRQAYFYSVPVEWIQALLQQPADNAERADTETAHPFWNQPATQQPFFMQVVQPYLSADWPALEAIAQQWVSHETNNAEAYFYLASAFHGQGQLALAQTAYERCLNLQAAHSDTWQGLAILAKQTQQMRVMSQAMQQLQQLDGKAYETLVKRLKEIT